MKPHVGSGKFTRIGSRLALGAGGLLLLLGACIIEERPFDQHLADCTQYCKEIDAQCPQVYDRPGACMAVCELMDQGDEFGGLVGNTVACRLTRLLQQDFEPATECATVGPGGNDVCGSNCEALCSLRAKVCGPINGQSALPDVTSNTACMRACQALPDDGTFDAARDRKGDTVQCRLIHVAESAISHDLAIEHCEHSQTIPPPGETVPCSDTTILTKEEECQKYCGIAMGACDSAEYKVFDSPEQCLASCRLVEPGMLGDQNGDSIRCRRYHSYAALGDPKEHCTHTGPTGDGHCGGGNCVSYCRIARQACPLAFTAEYGPDTDLLSGSDCEVACGMLDGAATNGFRDTEQRYTVTAPPVGDTLMCRTYHAVQALAARNDPRQCDAAFGVAGSECQ